MEANPLVNAIENYEQAASRNGELAKERAKALQYYLGESFGNEQEGRSSVVSRDVADTIEWIKPSLMRIFASGDEIVAFDPRGPEDTELAQQESDYVNHILTQKNNWFRTAYVWFTDALLQKNAYVKAWYELRKDVTKEKYEGLTEDQFVMLVQDPEVEVVAHEAYQDPAMAGAVDQMGNEVQAPMLHNVELSRNSEYGCVKYQEIPPERVIVSNWATSIDLEDVDFVEHFEWQTKSEMVSAGLKLPEHPGDEGGGDSAVSEEETRNLYGETMELGGEETNDASMKRYKVRECWIRFDSDGDGIAELKHVIVVGHSVLLEEDCEFIPLAAITPRMMPHRHIGRSAADDVMDLQEIKSALLRGGLDNMYLANNGRYGVNEDKVNLDDMLTSRPGGLVRTQGSPMDAIMPFAHPMVMGQTIQAIEYVDQIKQNRTGVTAYVTSVDDNALNKTASGTNMLQNAAMAKIELIARVFAETGVKRLMWLIHALSLKHARKAEVVRLRNKWVTVDPRTWKTRWDMTVSVGLGTGNRDQMMAHLQSIIQMQAMGMKIGLATPENIHHAAVKYTNAAGFKDAESYWTLPKGPQQPQPNPMAEVEQIKAQTSKELELFKSQDKDKDRAIKLRELDIKERELQLEGFKVGFQLQQSARPLPDAS